MDLLAKQLCSIKSLAWSRRAPIWCLRDRDCGGWLVQAALREVGFWIFPDEWAWELRNEIHIGRITDRRA